MAYNGLQHLLPRVVKERKNYRHPDIFTFTVFLSFDRTAGPPSLWGPGGVEVRAPRRTSLSLLGQLGTTACKRIGLQSNHRQAPVPGTGLRCAVSTVCVRYTNDTPHPGPRHVARWDPIPSPHRRPVATQLLRINYRPKTPKQPRSVVPMLGVLPPSARRWQQPHG
jgi:hypothetical protein